VHDVDVAMAFSRVDLSGSSQGNASDIERAANYEGEEVTQQ